MADTPTPAPAPAPEDKPQRSRNVINQKWLDELTDAEALAGIAQAPEHASLVIAEEKPTFLADLYRDICTARDCVSKALQKTTAKTQATGNEETAAKVLLEALAVIQACAKQKYSGSDKAALKGYFSGKDIGSSRSVLEQSAQSILDKVNGTDETPVDKLPGLKPEKIAAVAAALADYKATQASQSGEQSDATTLRNKLDEALHGKDGIVKRCRQIRFAADAEWPATDKKNAGVRVKFGLAKDKALRGGTPVNAQELNSQFDNMRKSLLAEIFYFDTGIKELNELLTRDKRKGIAIPGVGKTMSSTVVVKGSAGSGKSVLCSIMAYKLHQQFLKFTDSNKEHKILPFVFYFSFAQPAQGLCTYIEQILCPEWRLVKGLVFRQCFRGFERCRSGYLASF